MLHVGVDIVDIEHLGRALETAPRLGSRLFTEAEAEYCASGAKPLERMAARVAAKEATFKALGDGWPRFSWHDVEVVRAAGRPTLKLSGSAAEVAKGRRAEVSLSHDGGSAVAMVVLFQESA